MYIASLSYVICCTDIFLSIEARFATLATKQPSEEFYKKVLLELSQISQENTCSRASFFIENETLAQVFSCEFCKILRIPFLQNTSGRLQLTLATNSLMFSKAACTEPEF